MRSKLERKHKIVKNPFRASYKWSWLFSFLFLLIKVIRLIISPPSSNWRGLKEYYEFSPLFLFVWLCLIAPLWEEFFFRWFIIRKIGKGKWFFYLVSFFSFVMAHFIKLFNFSSFFNLSYYAVWFIFVYWLSDFNLFFPIFLHMSNNLLFFSFKMN